MIADPRVAVTSFHVKTTFVDDNATVGLAGYAGVFTATADFAVLKEELP